MARYRSGMASTRAASSAGEAMLISLALFVLPAPRMLQGLTGMIPLSTASFRMDLSSP